MARFRKMLSPIMTVKHYVHQTPTVIASGAILNITVANSVVAPATGASNQVQEGSVVKAVYLELWYVGTDATGTTSSFTGAIEKLTQATLGLMSFASSVNLTTYTNKRNLLYVTQAINGTRVDGTNPMPLYKGWIKIPKGKQRMALDDRIMFNVNSIGAGQVCGFFTYKEYR